MVGLRPSISAACRTSKSISLLDFCVIFTFVTLGADLMSIFQNL